MARINFDLFRRQIADAARHTFREVRATHPDETFYAFALYTVDDAVGITASANSEQWYARKRAEYAGDDWLTEVDLLGNFRWSPYDWEYDCVGADYFRPTDELIQHRGQGRYDAGGFVAYRAGVFATMVLALADLEAEGFFGVGAARRSVTVFCSVAHSDCTAWLEADSARRLNPAEVFEVFSAERIAYIGDDPDEPEPEGDDLYATYLARVRGGGGFA